MFGMNFRVLKAGDHVSASEWNALVAFVKGMARSSMVDGIMDSSGFHPRRRPIAAQSQIRNAYCKTNAGTGSTIDCYLDQDWNGSGAEPRVVTVQCNLFAGTNLSDCKPLLTDGRKIPVFLNNSEQFECLWWFNGSEPCDE